MPPIPTVTADRLESPAQPTRAARQQLAAPHLAVWSPLCVVGAAIVVIGVTGIRGADYPAHFVRALLWERSGVSAWNNLWYAGHATPTYSVVAPPLMAWIGPFWVVALSSLVATYCFTRLSRELTPNPTIADHVFAIAIVVNVIVGRAPFALGLAVALTAVLAWQRGRFEIALAAAFVTPLTSPVAGVFLAIAAAAVALTTRRREATAIALATTAPLVTVALLFGEPGQFPFRGFHFAASVATLCLLAAVSSSRIVRCGAILATLTAIMLFVVPNPLGGNFVRVCHMVAIPLSVAAVPAVRRSLRAPFVIALVAAVAWSLQPGVIAARDWWGDESLEAAYYEPLIAQVRARNRDGQPIGRLEIPFTKNHWESYFVVARDVPYARGWERQVDVVRNEPLYDPDLTVEEYREWLRANGVRWIAIPDVTLDHAGVIEQHLIDAPRASEIDWLRPVWFNDDWRLFEVRDYAAIVDQPGELIEQGADFLVVRTERAATVTIRYRYSEYLTITGSACVTADPAGWIVAELPAAGEYRLAVDPAGVLLGTAAESCG
jgi:hypothetical protein